MTTSYGYSSGWCERCGRRRGGDGRCANCDPWWTSALVQVGAPLLAACAALLVFVIATFGSRPTAVPTRSASSGSAATSGRGGGVLTSPLAPGYPMALNTSFPSAPAPSYVASAPMFPNNSVPGGSGWRSAPIVTPVNPDAARWAELEELRSMVWAADAYERKLPSAPSPSGTIFAATSIEANPN